MRRTVIALALFLSACTSTRMHIDVQGVSDRLFCGRSIPGGGEVTDADIDKFVAEVVEPRFPEGFTMWTATGNWEGQEEPTLVLEFLHPYGRRFDDEVREIAEEYRRRFNQEAVMRVTLPAVMEFVDK
ncbi:MAG TPA: DUF3574 domain-containing protein [Thermoanaerobaculia bacterium]|nr:DUF3574 domain-containing protein [Thermoanaerobaculia bacterium]